MGEVMPEVLGGSIGNAGGRRVPHPRFAAVRNDKIAKGLRRRI
jgi:hypothetical protein